MSTASGASGAASVVPPPRPRLQHRVLCYGDSLTAGTTSEDFFRNYPYAPHLETALTASDDSNLGVQVRHLGLPGWTAASMAQALDDGSVGLRATLRRIQETLEGQVPSVVIVLAGTNDLATSPDAQAIADHVAALHRAAREFGVPRTVAVGVPPSWYQSISEPARILTANVNQHLQAEAQSHAPAMSFVPFPFPYERDGSLWDPDGLHLSPQGYQILGECLAPAVRHLLRELDETTASPVPADL